MSVKAETAARKKARYYYSAGSREQARRNEAAAYEYFKRAYQTDPTYPEAAFAYGSRRLYVTIDTLQSDTELDRSLQMMRAYTDKYPGDMFENMFYGYVATQLDNPDEGIRVLERTYAIHPESPSLLLQISETHSRAGDLKKAAEALDRYERQAGRTAETTTAKLSYMLMEGDTLGAVREVSLLTAQNPRAVSYAILKGNLFDIVDMPDSALAAYQRAESLDNESGEAKLALARHYRERGDSAAFDQKMYEVLLTEDMDVGQKVELVAEYLQTLIDDKKDHKRGDYLFSVLQEQYPHEPRVLDLAARYSAAKENYDEAAEQISYAIDLDSSQLKYWGQLMTYLSAAGKYDEALATFDRSLSHITPDRTYRMFYVSVAQTAKKYDRAIDMLRSMITGIQEDLPVDSTINIRDLRHDITGEELEELGMLLSTLGDVYHLAGDNAAAYRTYENALALDDSNSLARNNYAYFLSQDENPDLDKALELSKATLTGFGASNPTYLDTYAWICFLKGNLDEALEYQTKAIEEMEENEYLKSADVYLHFGDMLAAKGDWNGAVEAWRKSVALAEELEETDEPHYKEALDKIRDGEPRMTKVPAAESDSQSEAKPLLPENNTSE